MRRNHTNRYINHEMCKGWNAYHGHLITLCFSRWWMLGFDMAKAADREERERSRFGLNASSTQPGTRHCMSVT